MSISVAINESFGSVTIWAFLVFTLLLLLSLAFYIRSLLKAKESLQDKCATLGEQVGNLQRELESWHRDLLTNLLSRRMWQEEFRRMYNVAYKKLFLRDGESRSSDSDESAKSDSSRELTLVYLDIDHFKKVNDTYGHPVGDLVLKRIGELINMIIRPGDLAGRIGGEEFVVALNTDVFGAQAFLRRFRKLLAMQSFTTEHGTTFEVTVSAGAVQLVLEETSIEKLIARADELLYLAKKDGRNRYAMQEGSGVQFYEH